MRVERIVRRSSLKKRVENTRIIQRRLATLDRDLQAAYLRGVEVGRANKQP
jgi:hypothetical protein